MLHSNVVVGDNHYIQQWSVADTTARDALVVAAADVGKVCEVGAAGATKTFYVLADDSPMTWTELGGSGGAGTVTSVTSANADATVATQTTTPVITIIQAPALRSATTTVNVSSATAPTNGQVLTATSGTAATWQTPAAGGGTTVPAINGFRLSLTTGVPVATSDVTTATTIYCTPYKGNQISLYDGVSAWTTVSSAEFSLVVGTLTSGLNYDVFCYNNGGTATLEFTAWTNDTTRATALTYQDGILVKTGATTRRYLGTFRTISTTETCDTARQRFLWNYYNRVSRKLKVVDTTDSWTYSTAAFRQANGSAANQIEVVLGVLESFSSFSLIARVVNSSTTSVNCAVGIGINSTTTNSADVLVNANCTNTIGAQPTAFLSHGALGYTYYTWLEYGNGALTQTWYGDSAVTYLQTGMVGELIG